MGIVYCIAAVPYVVQAVTLAHQNLSLLPKDVLFAGLGFLMCFFGGIFPATIAAVEAWRMCGGDEAWRNVKLLVGEFQKAQAANAEDEKKDLNKDGIPDAKQLEAKDLIVRKVAVAAAAVEPEVFTNATFGIYSGWIGVLAILKIQFAKTITLGERIGEQIYQPVSTKVEPVITEMTPEEFRKWVPTGVRIGCKLITVILAWWCTRVISGFHSAIRGGRLFSKYLVKHLHEKDILTAEQANLDEYIGWAVAALGFVFQFYVGFGVPFPFNLVLWPLQLVEAFVTWSV